MSRYPAETQQYLTRIAALAETFTVPPAVAPGPPATGDGLSAAAVGYARTQSPGSPTCGAGEA